LRRATLGVLEAGTEPARKLLEALIALPVKPKRDVPAAELAARCVARAEKELREHLDAEPTDAVALHELRIAYKQLRYALDIFVDVLPAASVARSKEAANFQKRLGEIHDLDVAQDTVVRARALPEATQQRAQKALAAARDEALGKFLVLKVHVARKAAQAHAEAVRAKAAAPMVAKKAVAKKAARKAPRTGVTARNAKP
jgi:CHAD domain-containing protein